MYVTLGLDLDHLPQQQQPREALAAQLTKHLKALLVSQSQGETMTMKMNIIPTTAVGVGMLDPHQLSSHGGLLSPTLLVDTLTLLAG